MNNPQSLSSAYLRFLNLMQAVRTLPMFPTIDALEERLLNVLAASWAQDKKITVLTATAMLSDTSATTLHRRLKSMRAKGLIDLQVDTVDFRVKYVVPTALTQRYFSELGACMHKASQST
ncbi:MAG: winged helix-turn-helix domain-containing protein [Hydrogenophaga sp.]|jgi:DNA-binding MarR family transcriptional regulator